MGDCLFSDVTFKKSANFSNSIFEKYADFDGIDVDGSITFQYSVFKGHFDMYRTAFDKADIDFDGVSFLNEAVMERVSFPQKVNFSEVKLSGKLSFIDAEFDNSADFSHLDLSNNSEIIFSNVKLPHYLDFSENQKIYNEIDLTSDTYKDSTYITYIKLYHTNISKLRLDYFKFRLDLKDSSGKGIQKDDVGFIYEELLKNFKEHGQLESYKLLDIEYQTYKDESYKKILSKISKTWWNFGYDKGLIFKNSLLLFIVFSILTFIFYNGLNNKVYALKNIPDTIPFRNLIKRLWYSVIYTACIFFQLTLKLDKLKFNKIAIIYIIVVYTTGIICLAYMANFVLQK